MKNLLNKNRKSILIMRKEQSIKTFFLQKTELLYIKSRVLASYFKIN